MRIVEQRSDITRKVTENGAEYHGDLTKAVTHLIAAAPRGKKYEYAVQWRIKIVSIEWLQDSLDRGMALDEIYYNPVLPIEERGKGAIAVKDVVSPSTLKKRQREAQAIQSEEMGRKKLRRTTSTKLESQNDDIWANIGTGEDDDSNNAPTTWDEPPQRSRHIEKAAVPSAPRRDQSEEPCLGAQEPQTDARSERPPGQTTEDSIFPRTRVYAAGFEERKVRDLPRAMRSCLTRGRNQSFTAI